MEDANPFFTAKVHIKAKTLSCQQDYKIDRTMIGKPL